MTMRAALLSGALVAVSGILPGPFADPRGRKAEGGSPHGRPLRPVDLRPQFERRRERSARGHAEGRRDRRWPAAEWA